MKRSICIWLGFAVVFVLTMFPPWLQVTRPIGGYPTITEKLWHAPLWQGPSPSHRWTSVYVDYSRMITEVAVGECFVLALYLTWGRNPPASKEPPIEQSPEVPLPQPQPERTPQTPRPAVHFTPKAADTPKATGAEKIGTLRQNLLRKVAWDDAAVERLIEFERTRLPDAPLQTLYESAIERWERDNR
jgi:hypothetical protein